MRAAVLVTFFCASILPAFAPGSQQPVPVQPGAVTPGAVEPGAVKPDSVKPDSGKPGAGKTGNGVTGRLFVDSVVATVNDSTILQSKLFSTAAGSLRTQRLERGRELTIREIEAQIREDLFALIHRYQMAQSAKSFGRLTPDQIDQILSAELEREKQDRSRDLGGYLALSEELEREGRTWPTYAKEQRIEKLHGFAEQFAIWDRLRKQSNLYLTPRMLRETYQAQKSFFVSPARAVVAMVVFRGAKAAEEAKAATEMWREGDWSARQVAERFPGSTALQAVRGKSLRSELSAFALAGPLGSVSGPMPRGDGSIDLAKVMQYAPASNGQFEDPEVQAVVRQMAQRRLVDEFRRQALVRARERTEFSIYKNGRRVKMR